jgi:hypothetical protein
MKPTSIRLTIKIFAPRSNQLIGSHSLLDWIVFFNQRVNINVILKSSWLNFIVFR